MPKRSRYSVEQSYFNYAFVAPTRLNLKHKAGMYIEPDILSILSTNLTEKPLPDIQLWNKFFKKTQKARPDLQLGNKFFKMAGV